MHKKLKSLQRIFKLAELKQIINNIIYFIKYVHILFKIFANLEVNIFTFNSTTYKTQNYKAVCNRNCIISVFFIFKQKLLYCYYI